MSHSEPLLRTRIVSTTTLRGPEIAYCRSSIELFQQCLQPALAGQHVPFHQAARFPDAESLS